MTDPTSTPLNVRDAHMENPRSAQTVVSEIGVDMSRYPTAARTGTLPEPHSLVGGMTDRRRSVRWAARESWGLKSPRRSDEERRIRKRG